MIKKRLCIFNDISYKDTISILLLVIVFSGIFGFIYETIFYRIDLGYFVKRGSTFGPWIPIYGIGSLFIVLFSYKYRNNYLFVFIISSFISGLLEYIVGYVLFKYFNIRLWDYNNEILNFGNIGGFICLRSILFFGISSLFLIYIVLPNIINLVIRYNKLNYISVILGSLFLIDCLSYVIIN